MVYDLIMILILIAATVWGIYKGLAWQIASLASIFVSYIVAFQFRGVVAANINADPPWNMFLSMLILYLGTSLIIWVGFRMVKSTIDKVKLQEFDKHVGGVFGFAKGAVLCVIVTLFAVSLMGEQEQQHIIDSHSGYCIAIILDKSHSVLPVEMNEQVHAVMHKLDDSLPAGYQRAHDDHHKEPNTPTDGNGYNFGASAESPEDHTASNPDNGLFNSFHR